jgi:hypothetical protein
MEGKITLITPPDIFENETYSILFINLNEDDQTAVSHWLANSTVKENINIYSYSGETDVPWLFHALARCEYKYIDLNSLNTITSTLNGYILGKKNTYYKTNDENVSAICHYINQNRITNIEAFLQKAFNDEN